MRLFAFLLISLFVVSVATAGGKKGIGLRDLRAADRIAALQVAWYYTWTPYPIQGVAREKFVPMVWGGDRLHREIAALGAEGKVPLLLAINEPNRREQANMSVQKVIRHWPKIEALAARVSSPAVAGMPGRWFKRFYRLAGIRGLRVDFMAIHLYGPPDPRKFLAKIDSVHQKYGLPIWITEFAVADWDAKRPENNRYPETKILEFMKQVLPELENRNFIERYAWFGAGRYSLSHAQVYTSRLFDRNGNLTPLGRFYAHFQFGNGPDSGLSAHEPTAGTFLERACSLVLSFGLNCAVR